MPGPSVIRLQAQQHISRWANNSVSDLNNESDNSALNYDMS